MAAAAAGVVDVAVAVFAVVENLSMLATGATQTYCQVGGSFQRAGKSALGCQSPAGCMLVRLLKNYIK